MREKSSKEVAMNIKNALASFQSNFLNQNQSKATLDQLHDRWPQNKWTERDSGATETDVVSTVNRDAPDRFQM